MSTRNTWTKDIQLNTDRAIDGIVAVRVKMMYAFKLGMSTQVRARWAHASVDEHQVDVLDVCG